VAADNLFSSFLSFSVSCGMICVTTAVDVTQQQSQSYSLIQEKEREREKRRERGLLFSSEKKGIHSFPFIALTQIFTVLGDSGKGKGKREQQQ
jgi:hypothetical protein